MTTLCADPCRRRRPAGSEAAWQIARRGVPVVLHEMRPVRSTAVHKTAGLRRARLLELVPFRRRAGQAPSASCMPKCGGSVRWSCGRPTTTNCRPAERWPSTATASPPRSPRRSNASRWSTSGARKISLPPPEWDSVVVATGPLTSPALARNDPRVHRRISARLLRRHRADRSPRFDRLRRRLVSIALRQDWDPRAPAPITSIAR